MKRGGLFILLILGFKMSNAQKAVVANDELKILYRNYENKISINKNGYDCSQLRLRAIKRYDIDSTEISGEGCQYRIKTNLFGAIDLIIEGRKDDATFESDTVKFLLRSIQSPIPTLGGRLRGGSIRNDILKAEAGIIPVCNTDMPVRPYVLSYDFHYKNKYHKNNQDLKAYGPMFTSEMRKALDHIQNGDSVLFDHIIVKYANVSSEDIGSLLFLINGEKSPKDLRQQDARDKFTKRINNTILRIKIRAASNESLASAQRRLCGRWEIIDVFTDMAICGLPIDYCGKLPLCDQSRVIRFSKNGSFITDDTGLVKKYEVGLFDKDSTAFRLQLDRDIFAYIPVNRKICKFIWFNGEPDAGVWYRKLTYTLFRRGRRK